MRHGQFFGGMFEVSDPIGSLPVVSGQCYWIGVGFRRRFDRKA